MVRRQNDERAASAAVAAGMQLEPAAMREPRPRFRNPIAVRREQPQHGVEGDLAQRDDDLNTVERAVLLRQEYGTAIQFRRLRFVVRRRAAAGGADIRILQLLAVVAWLQDLARNPTLFRSAGATAYAHARADALSREYLGARRKHFTVVFRQHQHLL